MRLKRTVTPQFWPIERKTKKFAIAPSPGPHAKEKCIPLGIILRDMMRYANTAKEAQWLLNKGEVKIDGHVRKSNNFPVGLMDIFAVGEEYYRVLPNARGFYLQKIGDSEARIKPEKIVSKTTIKKGRIQLNLSDGRNVLVDKDEYSTGDTVILDIGKNTLTHAIKMKPGMLALVTGGKNAGRTGKIEGIATVKMQPSQVTLHTNGGRIIVPKDYVFVIGEKEPAIKLGE